MLQRMSKTFVAGTKFVRMCNEYITKTRLRESPLMKSKLSLSSSQTSSIGELLGKKSKNGRPG